MTNEERQEYQLMYNTLHTIAYKFENIDTMQESSQSIGLSKQEYLEMAYENIQMIAEAAIKVVENEENE